MEPQASVLYGLPKLHKENIPLKSIVAYCQVPSYKLCQKLSVILPELIKFKNSLDLIAKLQSLNLSKIFLMVSFNVTNFFEFVSLPNSYRFLYNTPVPDKSQKELHNLLDLCIMQNY